MSDLFSFAEALPRYPHGPGSKERHGTSEEAARRIAPNAETVRLRVLAVLQSGAQLTADEIADRLGLSILTVRPRCSELSERRLIEKAGIRRPNASGMNAHVWRATQ